MVSYGIGIVFYFLEDNIFMLQFPHLYSRNVNTYSTAFKCYYKKSNMKDQYKALYNYRTASVNIF